MVPRATQVATPCTTTSHSLPTVTVIQIPAVTVLQMGFDEEHADNRCVELCGGKPCADIIHIKLEKRYADGCSKDTDTYLRIPMDILGGWVNISDMKVEG